MKTTHKISLLVCVLIALLGIVWCWQAMESLPVAQADLDKIKISLSKESVKDILGEPANITASATGEVWRYSKDWKWTMVDIRFDSEGKVEEIGVDR